MRRTKIHPLSSIGWARVRGSYARAEESFLILTPPRRWDWISLKKATVSYAHPKGLRPTASLTSTGSPLPRSTLMGPESGKERHCVRTLIVSFVFMLLTENPAVALGEQTIDSPKPFPSSLKSSATGKIVGSVRFLGRFERPKPFLVYKNRNFCGARVTNESLLLNGNGGTVHNASGFDPLGAASR